MEQQNLEYVPDTLMPWLIRWEQELKRKVFADEPEYFAEHAVQGLLRGDQAARANFYKELFGLAALSPNEIRSLENFNEIGPSGDTYWVASNNYTPIQQSLGAAPEDTDADDMPSPFPAIPGRNGTNGTHPEEED
jgi:phage portal protein BeeE